MKHLTNERLDVALSRALAKAKRLMEQYPRTWGLHMIACRCGDVMDEYVRRHRKEKVKR